ncbi:hypothetical protein [uncultured Sphingomonas sp.]|uniref:hypothetical protein n=1 Tax=uncultured Sphingomonas sp. TaxID=158754 RepID=UPI0035CA5782
MQPLDTWLVGFGLRSLALLCLELGCFLFVVPTLFDLHSDLADAAAAILAIAALVGGFVGIVGLTREATALIRDKDQ